MLITLRQWQKRDFKRTVVVYIDKRTASLREAFVYAFVGVVVYTHAVSQANTLVGYGQRVEVVVSHKHAFAAAELDHFAEELAFFCLWISEIIVLFLHESAMICCLARTSITLFPALFELFWRNVEKRKGFCNLTVL